MLGKMVSDQVLAAIDNYIGFRYPPFEDRIDHCPELINSIETQDSLSMLEIIGNEQGKPLRHMDGVACGIFPETEGVVTGTRGGTARGGTSEAPDNSHRAQSAPRETGCFQTARLKR